MNRENAKRLGAKLKELRETYHYSQADIAAAAEVRQPTYSNYENGRRMPSSAVIFRIAAYYGMLADELISYCVDLDEDIFFDRSEPNDSTREKEEFLAFSRLKKYSSLTPNEKELLFYFSKLDNETQSEIIDYSRYKHKKNIRQPVEEMPDDTDTKDNSDH